MKNDDNMELAVDDIFYMAWVGHFSKLMKDNNENN